MRRYFVWILLGIAVGLGITAALLNSLPHTFHGSVIQEKYTAPDFALSDGQGGVFRLSDQRGRLALIFFGYVSCPDVCPTTLSTLKQVRRSLGGDAENVEVVFITVDPARDTPEKVAGYVDSFDPAFHGLSGSEQELAPVWEDYAVYFKLNKANPDDMVYTVDHSSQVYLVDSAGDLRLTYSFGTPAEQILSDVKYLLRKR